LRAHPTHAHTKPTSSSASSSSSSSSSTFAFAPFFLLAFGLALALAGALARVLRGGMLECLQLDAAQKKSVDRFQLLSSARKLQKILLRRSSKFG
jgi:hypothetical protein